MPLHAPQTHDMQWLSPSPTVLCSLDHHSRSSDWCCRAVASRGQPWSGGPHRVLEAFSRILMCVTMIGCAWSIHALHSLPLATYHCETFAVRAHGRAWGVSFSLVRSFFTIAVCSPTMSPMWKRVLSFRFVWSVVVPARACMRSVAAPMPNSDTVITVSRTAS